MISSQVIRTNIEELHTITKINLCVYDLDGMVVASTFDTNDIQAGIVGDFIVSPADSQIIGTDHLLKIRDEGNWHIFWLQGEAAMKHIWLPE